MNTVLQEAVSIVASERSTQFNKAHEAARSVLEAFGEEGIAERVASEIPGTVSWEVVADLLGLLVWSTRDNGASIRRQAEQWLIQGSNLREVQIALHLEAYPFEELENMEHVFSQVAKSFPTVVRRCEALIKERREQERRQ